ncbi:MAG TPA: S8 family serine peptidase [Candidatus Baltobacteraceae bacterium]|nr:S8 family serine peptidase [Candidatus Baltobacteraceae bacterium]
MRSLRRLVCGVLCFAFLANAAPLAASAQTILYRVSLPGGKTAVVFSNGVAQVYSKDRKSVRTQVLLPSYGDADATHPVLPDKTEAAMQLLRAPDQPFGSNELIVVFRDGIAAQSDLTTVGKATLASLRKNRQTLSYNVPQYTNDAIVNRALAVMGADRVERLFRNVNRSTLANMRSGAQARLGRQLLNIAGAYRVHVTGEPLLKAVSDLRALSSVAYVAPDWRVQSMAAPPISVGAADVARARTQQYGGMRMRSAMRLGLTPSAVPANYAVQSSLQSMLNTPSLDAAAAFDEIQTKYHQLPGTGEIITNVSLGDLDDASATTSSSDRCNFWASVYGPTTIVTGGQRYLDFPSMPLIPAYTSDSSGNLSGTNEVCGIDPFLDEIGLDFSVMAPLPDDVQRPGEQGSGMTDLLGVAPGASYRLVVPQSSSPSNSDILAAMLGAAMQQPHPNVINASLGFGLDVYGFSGRYFEDDPLAESVVASIVQNLGIVMTIAAGDGVRTYTTVAIGANGGSAPTNVARNSSQLTDLNDVAFSGVPSSDLDSGSIDVGGSTLDDLFARPPQYAGGPFTAQHAYAETRWTGFTNFSSGDGSRVNVSAPSDNIIALTHAFGGAPDGVNVVLSGGTSASAPETAAAAAVVLQLARLTGRTMSPLDVRDFLTKTGSPVFGVPQADVNPHVGPQIDLRAAVEKILAMAGTIGTPSVARVAVEQRRNFANLDGAFLSNTDPGNIVLDDPSDQDRYQTSWITIAPDWEWMPLGTQYRLFVTGHPNSAIANTPWARALPLTLLSAAGLPLASTTTRTVNLTYEASKGTKTLASASFSLTFGPTRDTHYGVLAPDVPPVVTGSTIPVSYDLRAIRGTNAPEVVVSEPGRMSPATGNLFHTLYKAPLPNLHGTVYVPVSALQGGGMYGVDVIYDSAIGRHSDPAFTRVQPSSAVALQADAPLLSTGTATPGHYLEIPYGGSFQVAYNVGDIPGATGAILEISAAGPGAWNIYNPFNNPSGSICDKNGVDTGSVYCQPVMGTSGVVTLHAKDVGLLPTLNEVVRVIPLKGMSAAGEAGEVSSITMDGVLASDGGGVQNGFGVSQSGTDGFITSGQLTASGQILTSLETFDQTSNHIAQTVASASNSLYYTPGFAGLFGNDIALFGLQDQSTYNSTFNLLDTVSSGTIGSAWTPTAAINNLYLGEAAENGANDVAAFYGYDPSGAHNDNYRLFTSDIVHNTFGSIYDISAPLQSMGLPNVWGIAENTATNQGILPAEDFFANCAAPTLITVDLGTGNVGSFLGTGAGFPYGIAVDSKTNKAAIPTLCDGGFSIYDLASKSANEVFLPGNFNGFYTEADPAHGEFLVAQTVAPNFGSNNNSLSRVLVYDESGDLLAVKEQFDLFNAFLTIQAHYLQVNPARRNGYMIGPFAQQLVPFGY